MFCRNCAAEIDEGSVYCKQCGTPVSGPLAKPASGGTNVALIVVGVIVGGFVLVVFVGILAAIAIPKFANTKERAYQAAMKSDLRNLITAHESYFAQNKFTYAPNMIALAPLYRASQGVTITLEDVTAKGWRATSTHSATTKKCTVAIGDAVSDTSAEGEPVCK